MSQPFLLGITPDQGTQNKAFPFVLLHLSDVPLSKSPCVFGQKTRLNTQALLHTNGKEKNNSQSAILFKKSDDSYHLNHIYRMHERLKRRHKKELALFITNHLFTLSKSAVQVASPPQINEAREISYRLLRTTEDSRVVDQLQWYQIHLGYKQFSQELERHAELIHQNFYLAQSI